MTTPYELRATSWQNAVRSKMDRYEGLARAFVGLADTLVADFDVIELAQQLVENAMALLPIDAAGIVLADVHGRFQVLASNSEQTRLLELFQIQHDNGPCLLATAPANKWSSRICDRHRPLAGFRRTGHRIRLFVRSCTAATAAYDLVGALNLLRFDSGKMPGTDIAIGQALADVATIGIVHQRVASQSDVLNQQLQTALNSRTVIEQAKGVLAERGGVDMDAAFGLLRGYARSNNRRLADVARSVLRAPTLPASSTRADSRPTGQGLGSPDEFPSLSLCAAALGSSAGDVSFASAADESS